MNNDTLTKKPSPKTASKIIKLELLKRDMNYFDLERKLTEAGVNESVEGIRNKMSRGGFSAVFFLQCLRAIGVTNLEFKEEIDKELFY